MQDKLTTVSQIIIFLDFILSTEQEIITTMSSYQIFKEKAGIVTAFGNLKKELEKLFGRALTLRLSYSDMYKHISYTQRNETAKVVEVLKCYIDLIDIAKNDALINEKESKILIKVYDHLNRCCYQRDRLDDVIGAAKEELKKELQTIAVEIKDKENTLIILSQQTDALQQRLDIEKENIEKQNIKIAQQSQDLQKAFMSILTIFTGVVFTLFGGLNILSQLFSGIKHIEEPKELFGLLLIGIFFALLIYIIVAGLLLFAKKNTKETLDGYNKNILISGAIFVLLFVGISIVYYISPYPQYEIKTEDKQTVVSHVKDLESLS